MLNDWRGFYALLAQHWRNLMRTGAAGRLAPVVAPVVISPPLGGGDINHHWRRHHRRRQGALTGALSAQTGAKIKNPVLVYDPEKDEAEGRTGLPF